MLMRPIDRVTDRVTAVFSRVHRGEGLPVVILLVDLFLILTAYYLLKVVREPLILLDGGAAVKSYAAAGQTVLLVILVPAYGWVASRVPRMALVNGVTAMFAVSFVAFWLAYQAGMPVGVPFYLWLGIFNMLVVAQFWSLANELFSEPQGKRLFPIIAMGGTLGAIAGAWAARFLIDVIGISLMMPVAALLLVICIALTVLGARAAKRILPTDETIGHAVSDDPLSREGGFELITRIGYLRLIALTIVVYNVVNTLGEFILGYVVTATAKVDAAGDVELAKRIVGEFYGGYFTWVNAIAAVLQAFVVSRVVRYLGVRVSLLVLPAISLGGYTLIATVPLVAWIKITKITENSVDYSLHNTVRQMLWLPTTTEAKYKAKAAVDTFFVRFGDVLAAGIVWIGTSLALSPRMFAGVNIAVVCVWIVLAILLGREYARCSRVPSARKQKRPRREHRDEAASSLHATIVARARP